MYHLDRNGRRSVWGSSFFDRDFEKLFDTMTKGTDDVLYAPVCEIKDEEKQYSVSLDVPGLKPEDITLEVKDNQLFVTGERKFVAQSEKDNVLRSERRYGKFSRIFTLPQNVKAEAIEARFENGVLDIFLPKEEKAQARKISINSGLGGQKTIEQ